MNDRFKMLKELADSLEDLVDRSSLSDVLEALEGMCDEKADHVATNWQDRPLSKQWAKAARAIGRASQSVEGI
jgi:hypothetical protein